MIIHEKIFAEISFRNGTRIKLAEKEIVSASVRRQCCPDSNFEIGGVYSASLSMTASVSGTNSYNIRGAKIVLSTKYGNEENFQPMGTFWVTQASRISGDLYSLTAQDAVGWLETSSFNCSEDDKKMFENLTRYIGETYNQSPGTIQVWCWRIAIETCNALLSRTFGENLLTWEDYNTAVNGRYTNDWNFEAVSGDIRNLLLTCSVRNASGQTNSPRELLHYLAELAGGFIYAKENGNLTLGQFGQAEFGQAEIFLHEIEMNSCETAEYQLQNILVLLRACGHEDSTFTTIADTVLQTPFRIQIDSNPFLDGFTETAGNGYFTDYEARYGNGLYPFKEGLYYFHHRKDDEGALTSDRCAFRPFHCRVHKQERFHLGQRVKLALGEDNPVLSTITSIKWTFRGGWELACAGEDSRTMADALQRSKADKALTDVKLRYESLLSKIPGGGV
ncbi:MAG: hypothetical protein IJ642_05565 [Oscillospiraceae bacterium]|nr:hypothetical protein [Oscillospiraceae bacterium]